MYLANRLLNVVVGNPGRRSVRSSSIRLWLHARTTANSQVGGAFGKADTTCYDASSLASGNATWNAAPRSALRSAHSLPPCEVTSVRQIERPMPKPPFLLEWNG